MTFDLAARLAERHAAHLYRQRPLLESPQDPEVVVDGRPAAGLLFQRLSGLANHPEVIAAAARWRGNNGVVGGAPRTW